MNGWACSPCQIRSLRSRNVSEAGRVIDMALLLWRSRRVYACTRSGVWRAGRPAHHVTTPLLIGLDPQDDLAAGMSGREKPVRVDDPLERKPLGDDRSDDARRQQTRERPDPFAAVGDEEAVVRQVRVHDGVEVEVRGRDG